MPGMRLRDTKGRRNVTLTIVHPYITLSQPMLCPTCQVIHTKKTYHINLDDTSHCIVSPVVFEHLSHPAVNHDLDFANEVAKPPPATLGVGNGVPTIVVPKPRIVEITNVGV